MFQEKTDAKKFHKDLKERQAGFGLELQEGKTKLIEFGGMAQKDREEKGEGEPETFDFLG